MSTLDSFIKQWSKTPASNGITPNLVPYGWPEGQPPSSVNNCARQAMSDHRYQWEDAEWFCRGEKSALSTPTGTELSKVSATSFKITTDVTSVYHQNRRIKIFDTTTGYATITSSSYSAPDTTVNLQFDNNGSIGSSFSAVALAILSAHPSSIPRGSDLSKNLIIGGNLTTNPWQRQITFTSVADQTYTADRWQWLQGGSGAVTIEKAADAPTVSEAGIYSNACLNVDVTTADNTIAASDRYLLTQKVEGFFFSQIAQQPMTLSFWVKSTKTGIFCVSLSNSVPDKSYVAEYTINNSNAWEYKTVTFTASPSAGTWDYAMGVGIQLIFAIAAGSNYQGSAGSWQNGAVYATSNQVNGMDSTSNNFKIQFVQLESGSFASSFEIEDPATTLMKCQRYYEKSYNNETYLASATTAVGFLAAGAFSGLTGSLIRYSGTFKVNKRENTANPVAVAIYAYNTIATGALGVVSQDNQSDLSVSTKVVAQTGFFIDFTNGGGRYGGLFHYIASAEL